MKSQSWNSVFLVVAGIALGWIVTTLTYGRLNSSQTALVVEVLDGNTLEVLRNDEIIRVRVLGVDCPERGQPFGERARQRTGELTHRRKVSLRTNGRSRQGDLLAEIILPTGKSLGYTLVEEGLAWQDDDHTPRDSNVYMAQRRARAEKIGLWADPDPVSPWDWRNSKRME